MAYLIGAVLALSVGFAMTWIGMDKDRAFYPTVTIVIASYYALFALMGASSQVLWLELVVIAGFFSAAIAGFKRSLWIVVAALAAHGVFDLFHGRIIDNPGVPAWWPGFCLAYDVIAAAYLAWLLSRSRVPAVAIADANK